jgi:hypothetical protein
MHPIRVKLPGKPPKIVQKEQQPDQRQFSVVPIRAITDRGLTPMELRVLLVFCSYANRGGITWVGLKRVGEHLNIGVARTSTLAQALVKKGYIRVLFKGFAGERAQTRQIIFNDALSLDDIVAVTGEKAPYQVQQDIRQHQQAQSIQHKKAGNMARKRKINDQSVSNEVQSNLLPGDNAGTIDKNVINEQQVLQLQRAVGPDILALALDQAGPGATLEQVQVKLKSLLA